MRQLLVAVAGLSMVKAAGAAGSFRPSAQQLKSLTFEAVASRPFVSETLADGHIEIDADRQTPVYTPYSGRVVRLVAAPGNEVAAGQPLAEIDSNELAQARGDLASSEAQLSVARASEARRHALYDIQGGSLADWEQAQADLHVAEANLQVVRNHLHVLGFDDSAIDQLAREDNAGPTATLQSPIAGVVLDRQLGPGQYVQAGSGTPTYTIADLSTVWLVASVREADAGRVRPGQQMEVSVAAFPTRTYRARITYVAPQLDPNTHRLTVRATIENRDHALLPQMLASCRISTSTATLSPAVPERAVVYDGTATHVWVLRPDQSLDLRSVRIGRASDGQVEVLSGLRAGERVATRGALFLDAATANQ